MFHNNLVLLLSTNYENGDDVGLFVLGFLPSTQTNFVYVFLYRLHLNVDLYRFHFHIGILHRIHQYYMQCHLMISPLERRTWNMSDM